MIANVTLTTKEKYLLEDAKSHEEQCILKYGNYSKLAVDPQLKQIFTRLQQGEQEHLQTINQLLTGKVPAMGGQSNQGNQSGQTAQAPQQSAGVQNECNCYNASDKDLCTDMLMTEKYVSGAYDTTIFEFKDAQVRDVLNHIQTEEQKHGESIFAYMVSKGMYTPK